MRAKLPISCVLITKNVANKIEKCLQSVEDLCQEIIVVDCGSTDHTRVICEKYNAKIFFHAFEGFGPQKNWALAQTTRPWILHLDADEFLHPKLQEEIRVLFPTPSCEGYQIRRLNLLWGKPVKHGLWRNDYVLRLFKKTKGRFSNDNVHERVVLTGKTQTLPGYIVHDSYASLSDMITKMNHYSDLWAKDRPNEHIHFYSCLTRSVFVFLKSYFLKLGFLDGVRGLVVAITASHSVFYKYCKLFEQNKITK